MSHDSPSPTDHNPFTVPPHDAVLLQPDTSAEGDGTGGVIPFKNPAALAAYYLGLFSLFPLFGLLLAVPAFVLGILGLRARRRNPAVKGSIHAWIGIVMGGICSVVWGLAAIGIIVALIASQ